MVELTVDVDITESREVLVGMGMWMVAPCGVWVSELVRGFKFGGCRGGVGSLGMVRYVLTGAKLACFAGLEPLRAVRALRALFGRRCSTSGDNISSPLEPRFEPGADMEILGMSTDPESSSESEERDRTLVCWRSDSNMLWFVRLDAFDVRVCLLDTLFEHSASGDMMGRPGVIGLSGSKISSSSSAGSSMVGCWNDCDEKQLDSETGSSTECWCCRSRWPGCSFSPGSDSRTVRKDICS